ncbi:hypothetical protein EV715DRAFT_199607, partial [Schizophyllum commune]
PKIAILVRAGKFVTSPSSLPQLVMSRWINPTDVHEILHCAPGWLDGKSPALALRTSSLRAAVGIAWLEDRWMTGNQAAGRGSCLPPSGNVADRAQIMF